MDNEIWEAQYQSDYKPWVKPEKFIVDQVTSMTPGTAIDLGSGEGFNSIWLAENGWDVTAVDFAPTALKIAKDIAAERGIRINTEEDDILTYQPGKLFDLVYVGYILIPESARKILIENAVSLLAPGGTLLYVCFLRGEVQQDDMIPLEDMATPDDIVNHLIGLEIEISDTDHVIMDFEWGPFESDIVTIRARKPAQ